MLLSFVRFKKQKMFIEDWPIRILLAFSKAACYVPGRVVLTEWNAGSQAEKGNGMMMKNSVELLEHAIGYAKKQGFRVRSETLEGVNGGLCRVGNTTTIFLDQSTTATQQLAEIMAVLQRDSSKWKEASVGNQKVRKGR